MTNDMYFLLFISGVLILSTIISLVLKRIYQAPEQASVINNLYARVIAWWFMIAILSVAFLVGRYGTILLFFIISFMALREFLGQVGSRKGDYYALLISFYVILPVQYLFVIIDWYSMFSIFIPVYGFLILSILAAQSEDTTNFFARTAKVQWAVMITIFCVSHIPFLLNLPIIDYERNTVWLIVFLITVVQFSDVMQYVFGKLFGKHKIAPRLSPAKTIEGFLGGVISASLLAGFLSWMTPFNPFQAFVIGLIICLMGFWGGLVMSAIKRDRGIKDWGNIIQGHGGMLDRIDSLCFSAPIFFHIVRYFWVQN